MPDERNLPPLLFKPIYKEKIWGGRDLKARLNKDIPDGSLIGESWELSGLEGNESEIIRGNFSGKKISDIYCSEDNGRFPLLYKFIDAHGDLSIQIHPGFGASKGALDQKTECWYIVDAKPGTKVICGLRRGVSVSDVRNACMGNRLPEVCNYLDIKPGDMVFVPAGTIHGTFANTLIYEIQQSSDAIFRMYDWGRKGEAEKSRPLHVEDGLESINISYHENHIIRPLVINKKNVYHALRVACRHFAVEEYASENTAEWEIAAGKSFRVITILAGSLEIKNKNGCDIFIKGNTLLVPANSGNIKITSDGRAQILVSYIPDLKNDIMLPLVQKGITRDTINLLAGRPDDNDLAGII
jgi:mannose-6-phosphate isomerase